MTGLLAKLVEGISSIKSPLEDWSDYYQIAAMHTQIHPTKRFQLLTLCFPDTECGAGMQIPHCRDLRSILNLLGKNGAGEGIRTLDPNLGKVVLYP
jgi:hypothetical protein